MNVVQALKTIERIKSENPYFDRIYISCQNSIVKSNKPLSYFDRFIYYIKYDNITYIELVPSKYHTYVGYHQGLVDFLIKYKIYDIFVQDEETIDLRAKYYTKKQFACLTIIRYYKKYRYNLFKKRRDSLKQELTAYIYHPSRLKFEI